MSIGQKEKVLILCAGNSCRSQMAEGFWRHYGGDAFEVSSAGTDPSERVHPVAIQVMAEIGIDISQQRPKTVKEFLGRTIVQYLVIVCDDAQQKCPRIFPGMRERLFWPFEDPAQFTGTSEERLALFRRVRDGIREKILTFLRDKGKEYAGKH